MFVPLSLLVILYNMLLKKWYGVIPLFSRKHWICAYFIYAYKKGTPVFSEAPFDVYSG